MMRTEIEEIDGRDGDIVTELGYAAYDKQFTIGLYGSYDIDQVIKYFAGSGTVIFSNEPDKYYRYRIIDQIDYARLLRFKTATVTMHCQPFKYDIEDMGRLLNIHIYDGFPAVTMKGVTGKNAGTKIHISGTATQNSGLGFPLNQLDVREGDQLLYYVSGTGTPTMKIQGELGNTVLQCTISASTTEPTIIDLEQGSTAFPEGMKLKTLNVTVTNGTEYDLYITLYLIRYADERNYGNLGNAIAKPKYIIVTKGLNIMTINGVSAMSINAGNTKKIVIVDTDDMNAKLDDGTWFNRNVTADYDILRIQPEGGCIISFIHGTIDGVTGEVYGCAVENQSCWL